MNVILSKEMLPLIRRVGRTRMYYRCPVCNLVIKGNRNMASHLTGHHKSSTKHGQFPESYVLVKEGVVYSKGKTGSGVCQPLMQLIEKEAAFTK